MSRLELIINSDLNDVSLAAVAVHSLCIYLGLEEAEAFQVELCTVEAMTNAIRHAYHGQPGKTVSVVVISEADQLRLEIIDSGTPMSAMDVDRLVHGAQVIDLENIDRASLPEGGRGLQIMHDLMDRVAYKPGGSFNRLQLTKCIPLSRSPL